MNAIDHIEAALERLTQEDLAKLPPARLTRLSDQLYKAHVAAEMVAGQQAFAKVRRTYTGAPESGVLSDLKSGERSQ